MTMKPILLAKDTINRGDLHALAKWLTKADTPRLTQGPLVQKFEEAFAKWLGRSYAVFCNSGSSANLLAYAALDRKHYTVPAVSWPTTIAPALQLGASVELRDAFPDTWGSCWGTYDLNIVLVDVLGVPAYRSLGGSELAIEDCCGAHGSTTRGRKVGTFGTLSTFSFYFGHAMSTIEGGMVCTDDPDLYERLLMLRAHGWTADFPPSMRDRAAVRFTATEEAGFRRKFTFYVPGFNVRGTDLQAFLGLRGLKRLDANVARRTDNADLYWKLLKRLDLGVQTPMNGDTAAPIGIGILADDSMQRERIATALTAAGIEVRPIGGGNMARQPFLAGKAGREAFPVADTIHDRGFQVPNGPHLGTSDIRRVVRTIERAM